MKMIVYIILFALIIASSISFEFSSKKRRNSVSAYLKATSELGYRNGYKSLNVHTTSQEFFFYIDIKINNIEVISKLSTNKKDFSDYIQINNKVVEGKSFESLNSIPFLENATEIDQSIKESIFIKQGNLYKFNLDYIRIRSFTQSQAEPYIYSIIYLDGNKKEIKFDLIIKNYKPTESATPNDINFTTAQILSKNIEAKKAKIIGNYLKISQNIFNNIRRLKSDVIQRSLFLEGKEKINIFEKKLKDAEKDLSDCNKNYDEIQAKKTELMKQKALKEEEKKLIEQELVSCNLKIEIVVQKITNLQIYINKEKAKIDKWVKENQSSKKDQLQKIIYWTEAAVYYRILNKKLFNSEQEVEKGIQNNTIKENLMKIKRAFLPLDTNLDFLDKKLRRL